MSISRSDIPSSSSPSNDSYPHGSLIEVSCASGYKFNSVSINGSNTVRCMRGIWKPKRPECVIASCSPPVVANGQLYLHSFKVHADDQINHGESVHLHCSSGYSVKGSPVITCSYGNWITDFSKHTINSFSSCQPSPCVLPVIANGFYITSGFKEAMTISHGSSIDYSCRDGFIKRSDSSSLRCSEAHLIPSDPICISSSIITDTVKGKSVSNETTVTHHTTSSSSSEQNNLVLTIDANSRINNSLYTSDDELEEKISNFIAASDIELLNELNSIQDETDAKWKSETSVKDETRHGKRDYWCPSPEDIENTLRTTGSYRFPAVLNDGRPSPQVSLDDENKLFQYSSSFASPSLVTPLKPSSSSSLSPPVTSQVSLVSFPTAAREATSAAKTLLPRDEQSNTRVYQSMQSPIIYSLSASRSIAKRSLILDEVSDKMVQINRTFDGTDNTSNEGQVDTMMKTQVTIHSVSGADNVHGQSEDASSAEHTVAVNERITRKTSVYHSRYPIGSEFIFKCLAESVKKNITWKIKCIENVGWIGTSYPCVLDESEINMDTDDTFVMKENNNCTYQVKDDDDGDGEVNTILYAFHRDTLITQTSVFNSGEVINFRCSDIGKYQLSGPTAVSCVNGKWNDSLPLCDGLSQQYDYALEKPPTILFRHSNGTIAQSTSSTLIVTPATNLHLECLWIRKFGDPMWEYVTQRTQENVSFTYPQGWTAEVSRDSGLEYRLSIISATSSDSGVYTCVTPVKHRHSVVIEVKSVSCPVFTPSDIPKALRVNYWSLDTSGNRIDYVITAPMVYTFRIPMNGKVNVSCPPGMSLSEKRKSSDITCLPSGRWSSSLPQCIPTLCANISHIVSATHQVQLNNTSTGHPVARETGTRDDLTFPLAVPPLNVSGKNDTTFHNESLTWPSISMNGRTVGSRATFSCPRGFALLGVDELTCMSDGRWSSHLPQCIEIVCPSPPVIANGFIVPEDVREVYRFQDLITYNCLDGYVLRGNSMLFCQENRLWSNRQPLCEVA